MGIRYIVKIFIFCALSFFLTHSTFAQSNFGITVDNEIIDFGLMQTEEIKGDQPSQGITLTCKTTWANGWSLRIYLKNPLELQGYPYINIPSENFYWYGMNTTGQGTLVTNEEDFTEEKVLYQAPRGEGADGVDVKIRFKLKIPQYQAKGRYAGTITLTMVEAI